MEKSAVSADLLTFTKEILNENLRFLWGAAVVNNFERIRWIYLVCKTLNIDLLIWFESKDIKQPENVYPS